jgi:multicomponent Na+:H+ antiporter subunit G
MTAILELVSAICFLLGSVLCVTGGVGLLRMPDFFSRVHASGVTETLAAPLLLIGLALQMEWSLDLVKVAMILILVLATNPTATHAMAKATLHGGQRPLEFDKDRSTGGEGSSKP